jgi:hypothetical protein
MITKKRQDKQQLINLLINYGHYDWANRYKEILRKKDSRRSRKKILVKFFTMLKVTNARALEEQFIDNLDLDDVIYLANHCFDQQSRITNCNIGE